MSAPRSVIALGAVLLLAFAAGAAAATEPSSQQVLEQLQKGAAAVQRGNPETAIRDYFQPAIDSYERRFAKEKRRIFSASGTAESLYYLAFAAASTKQRDAVVVDGLWAEALYQKAYALVELERYDEAEAVLKTLLDLAPRHPLAWSELGALHQLRKDWDGAMSAYREAEDSVSMMDDRDGARHAEYVRLMSRALRGQGFVLIETDRLDEAEALYKRCLEMDPDDRGAKQELAYIAKLRSR